MNQAPAKRLSSPLFWSSLARAFAQTWHPKMLLLTLLPLVFCLGVSAVSFFLLWEGAVAGVRGLLDSSSLLQAGFGWLEWAGLQNAKTVLPLVIVGALSIPLLVLLALITTALLALPIALNFVATRRFSKLEKHGKAAFIVSVGYSLGWTLAALGVMIISAPLWLIPVFFFVLPPLIWGWLTYKVMSFDVLAEHATMAERQQLISNHRPQLLIIGITIGLIGAAPSLVLVSSVITLILLPLVSLVALWLYIVGFIFTALWFANYCLAALQELRGQQQALEVL